jgi:hypothetical protein
LPIAGDVIFILQAEKFLPAKSDYSPIMPHFKEFVNYNRGNPAEFCACCKPKHTPIFFQSRMIAALTLTLKRKARKRFLKKKSLSRFFDDRFIDSWSF